MSVDFAGAVWTYQRENLMLCNAQGGDIYYRMAAAVHADMANFQK